MTPFDAATATGDEMLAEAKRRQARREAGEPLRDEVAEQREQEIADRRREKAIQRDVRKFYIEHGCKVYWLSQPRETKQTPGIADLLVVHLPSNRAWWHETKSADGVMSTAQMIFRHDMLVCHIGYVSGGVEAARAALIERGIK